METLLKLLTLLTAPLWIILALVIVLIAIFIALISIPLALIFASFVIILVLPLSLFLSVKYKNYECSKSKEVIKISESKSEVILKDKCYKVEVLENVEVEKLYVDVGEVVVFGKVRDLKLGVGKVKNNNYIDNLDLALKFQYGKKRKKAKGCKIYRIKLYDTLEAELKSIREEAKIKEEMHRNWDNPEYWKKSI
jgi:hypothetical protein